MIGTKGFWVEDNEYCEIVGVIDEGAALYEFQPVDAVIPEGCDSYCLNWVGFIEDFSPEV